ncbi:ORF67 [Ictalurid herpesvirus 1]|nr:ORF67 [Ictalurid herpesvirus 1]
MESIVYDSDFSDDEVSALTLDNLPYTRKRIISDRRLLRHFGGLTDVTPGITLSVPEPNSVLKPWLIFPVEKGVLSVEIITAGTVVNKDLVDGRGWIHETTCVTEPALPSVNTITLGIVDFVSRSIVASGSEIFLLLTTDPGEGIGFKRMPCINTDGVTGAKISREVITDAPVVLYDDIYSLFHLTASLPRDVFLDCTGMTQAELERFAGLHLGGVPDWRYTPRKILISPPHYLTMNLTTLETWDSSDLLPPEPGFLQDVFIAAPSPKLRYTDDCMSAIKRTDTGVVIHGEPDVFFSFAENRVETLEFCAVDAPYPNPPQMSLVEDMTRKVVRTEAAIGTLTVELAPPDGVPEPLYSAEYVTVTHDRELRAYACVTSPALRTIVIGALGRNGVLHLLQHMELMVTMGFRDFRWKFREGNRELMYFVEAFIAAIPAPCAERMHVRIVLSRGHGSFRLWESGSHFRFRLMADPWSMSPNPRASNVVIRRPRQGVSLPPRRIPPRIIYEWTAMVRVTARTGALVSTRELTAEYRRALSITYNMIGDMLYIPVEPVLDGGGERLLDLPLSFTGFAFQWAEPPVVDSDAVSAGSRRAVIALHRLDYLEDAHVAVICSNVFMGTTACGAALQVAPADLPPGPFTVDLSVKPTDNPDVKLQQLTHRRNGFCGAYYDEAVTTGWFLGLLSGERMSIKDPSACLMSFYEKLHPIFLHGAKIGKCYVAHTFHPCTVDFVGCIVATSHMIQVADNVIIMARNPSSATCDTKFTIDSFNESVVRAIFKPENWIERYAQLFGPAYVMENTGHVVRFNGTGREVVKLTGIYPDTRTPGVQLVVTIDGKEFVIIPLGFSPMLVIDGRIAWYDLMAPGILVTSTTNNWVVIAENSRKMIERPSYGMSYECYRIEDRSDDLPSFPPRGRFWRTGPRDILRDSIFEHMVQRAVDGHTTLRNTVGAVELFREIPGIINTWTNYRVVPDRGYVPVGATGAMVVSDAPMREQLMALTSDTELSFKYPRANWYSENILSLGHGAIIKWQTVIITRKPDDPPIAHGGVKITVLKEPLGLLTDTELRPGIYERRQIPWAHHLVVTDFRLLFGTLLIATTLHRYVHVIVDAHGAGEQILKMALEQAPLFNEPKRVVITGLPSSALPATIYLGAMDPRNIRVAVTGGQELKNSVRDKLAGVMRYVSGDDFDVGITDREFFYAITGTGRAVESFMLRDPARYIVELAPEGSLPVYRDPFNPIGEVTGRFWFDEVPNPIAILTDSETNVYVMSRGDIITPGERRVVDLPEYSAWTPERLQEEPPPTTFLGSGDVAIVTLRRRPPVGARTKNLRLTIRNGVTMVLQRRDIVKVRLVDREAVKTSGLLVTSHSIGHTDDVYIPVTGGPLDYYAKIWSFHGLGGEEPCLDVVTPADCLAVAGAVRLFLVSLTHPVTFGCVNIVIPRALRPRFIRYFGTPIVMDRVLYDISIDRILTVGERDGDRRGVIHETRVNSDEWSRKLYFLKQRLISSGRHRKYWTERLTGTRLAPHDNRWLGAAWLTAGDGTTRRLLARENFIRCGRSTPQGQ